MLVEAMDLEGKIPARCLGVAVQEGNQETLVFLECEAGLDASVDLVVFCQ
jgi:hypothetical protein